MARVAITTLSLFVEAGGESPLLLLAFTRRISREHFRVCRGARLWLTDPIDLRTQACVDLADNSRDAKPRKDHRREHASRRSD